MIRAVKKKSYSKRKAEDYILKRRLKFAFSRFLKIFYIILAIAVISAGIWILKYDGYQKINDYSYKKLTGFFISLGLQIERVEIEGNKIVPKDIISKKIIESLGDVTQKSLILISLNRLESDITAIGWIDATEIRRKLPGTLIVRVTERKPSIIWQHQGNLWLGDTKGNLLTNKIERKYIYLPVVIGQNPENDVPELFSITSASKNLAELVTGASKIGNRRWDIMLNNGIRIMLPERRPAGSWKKLEELQQKNRLFSKSINYIDMRIEGQLITGLEQSNDITESKKKIELQNR